METSEMVAIAEATRDAVQSAVDRIVAPLARRIRELEAQQAKATALEAEVADLRLRIGLLDGDAGKRRSAPGAVAELRARIEGLEAANAPALRLARGGR